MSNQQFQRGLVLVFRDADVPQGGTGGDRNSGKAPRLKNSDLTSCSGSGLDAFVANLFACFKH